MGYLDQILGLATTGKVTKRVSFHGYEFDSEENIWILSKNITININFITSFGVFQGNCYIQAVRYHCIQ